ncbi:MAG: MarR family transcriptional regulator [Bradymonadaceae bacterium]|nr:MarR family transcriptional regulator [Lujinxingiaceae bacterium]
MKEFTTELLAICRHFGIMERNAICCGDITVPQCVALQRLLDGPLDASTLAEGLGTSLSATTRLVDGLERNGWVDRTRDPNDRRRVFIELSATGDAQARRLCRLTESMLDGVLSQIPADKHAQVLDSVQLLRRALDAVGEGGGGSCC